MFSSRIFIILPVRCKFRIYLDLIFVHVSKSTFNCLRTNKSPFSLPIHNVTSPTSNFHICVDQFQDSLLGSINFLSLYHIVCIIMALQIVLITSRQFPPPPYSLSLKLLWLFFAFGLPIKFKNLFVNFHENPCCYFGWNCIDLLCVLCIDLGSFLLDFFSLGMGLSSLTILLYQISNHIFFCS